jgi:hypothetical protein
VKKTAMPKLTRKSAADSSVASGAQAGLSR